MKLNMKYVLLTFFTFLMIFNVGFSDSNSPVVSGLGNISDEIKKACDSTSLCTGFSFLLLVIIFTVIFKQGTARMLPNHSRGAAAIAVALAIFGSVAILSKIDGNPLIEIGKNILFPLLLFALFAGSVAILRWIHSAQVSGFGKFLMYTGFLLMFLFTFLQLLGFAAQTAFKGIIETFPWIIGFLWSLLAFVFIIFIILLIGGIFLVKEFLDIFDGDDESSIAQKRKRKKEEREKEAQLVQDLERLKRSFHKMRESYDRKHELLKEISNMSPIQENLDYSEGANISQENRGNYQ